MIIKKQGEAAGSVSEAVALSNHAEKLFTDFLVQADVDMLPTKRREESLSTLKRLGVVTEVEANTIAAILAKGAGSTRVDMNMIVSEIDAARNSAVNPVTSAILNMMRVAPAEQTSSARRISISDKDWVEIGDGIIVGAAGGATAGAVVGAAGTAGFGTLAGAIGGALMGGVIGGAVKAGFSHL